MGSQNTLNTAAFNHAQQYSTFIVENLSDGLLPDVFSRDVSDFQKGSTLNIKTVGTATLQEATEEVPLTFNPIDTGNITLSMTDYVGDAWAVSDDVKEDYDQIETLMAMRAVESTRALQEYFETRALQVLGEAQTNADPNNVNGFPHRIVSGETNDEISIDHFRIMKLAFQKANAFGSGNIAIVDPVAGAVLDKLYTAAGVAYNPMFEGILTEGFTREHKFVRNIFGWDVWTSNRLPTMTGASDGTNSIAGNAVCNLFLNISDDNHRALMRAWRRMPSVEPMRNGKLRRDEYQVTSRFGLGIQRLDTIGTVWTSPTYYG